MKKKRAYGRIDLADNGMWRIEGEPHVMSKLKRIIRRVKYEVHVGYLANTPENCRDLEWFCQRYPMTVNGAARKLRVGARQHRETIARLEDLLDPNYKPRDFDLAIPLRSYQRQALEIYLARGYLLVADDVGLGKTAIAIGSFTDRGSLPAVVVTLTFLTTQWAEEIKRFCPGLTVHCIKKGTPYELPKIDGRGPDVLILNYHKLNGWAQVLGKYAKSACFDEIHELRRRDSFKYRAALHLSAAVDRQLGLTATPIYNYGGEFWNVMSALRFDALGTWGEFAREWCGGMVDEKAMIGQPDAFGRYLRDEILMIRRTRKEVGRELPKLTTDVITVDSDAKALESINDQAVELAQIILKRTTATHVDRFQASGEFEQIVRQATGLAKAPYVAAFVDLLRNAGEQVLLFGWHHAVYDVWASRLRKWNPAKFTGRETPHKKAAAKQAFLDGKARVLMMSLRAGQGIDGLQKCCRTVVIGELDWAPAVLHQDIGRVHRDGQSEPVNAYYLVTADGADPVMVDVLGLKRQQSEGIRNPDRPLVKKLQTDPKDLQRLAREYLLNATQKEGSPRC